MRTLVLILTTLFISSSAMANEKHNFVFYMKDSNGVERLEYSVESSYEEAFEKAAKYCYKHFKNSQRLTEDRGLDIIDVCANPRKK